MRSVGWRFTSRWPEVAVALLLLTGVAVAGGFALQAASRDVTAQRTDEHEERFVASKRIARRENVEHERP